jgi:uncharacterized protein
MVEIPLLLRESPLDSAGACGGPQPSSEASSHWVTSRFTVRASAEDGRMVLWNTLRGSVSVFSPEQSAVVTDMLRRRELQGKPEGLLKYLVERGFKVRSGEDEFRKFQLYFGRQHYRTDELRLILLASEDCNFRCRYCYETFPRGTMAPEVRRGITRMVAKRFAESSLRYLRVGWFGGEPLYGWPAIEELSTELMAWSREHGVTYESSMTTNAFLLTPEVADKLLDWQVRSFQITVDGPKKQHDESRPARDGSGTFSTILDNLEALSRRTGDFQVNLRVNYDQASHRFLEEMFDILQRRLRCDPRFQLRFHPIGCFGGDNDPRLQVRGPEREEIEATLKTAALRRGLRLGSIQDSTTLGSQVCYAARPNNLIIGAGGTLMKCTVVLYRDERNIVGSIAPDGTLKLDVDKLARWTAPAFENDEKCRRCFVLPTCQGAYCPLMRIEERGTPCSPLRTNFKQELSRGLGGGGGPQQQRQVQVPL